MIVTEYYKTRSDGVMLNRTYSDVGMRVLQNETGVEYDDAVDVEGAPYTYTEIDSEEEATESDYIKTLERFGVAND